MSKRLLFAGALAALITISGLPSLLTNLTISQGRHAVVHASSNTPEPRQTRTALQSSPAVVAKPVSPASFATMNPTTQLLRHDNVGALPYDVLVVKQDVDLGEIFIDSGK